MEDGCGVSSMVAGSGIGCGVSGDDISEDTEDTADPSDRRSTSFWMINNNTLRSSSIGWDIPTYNIKRLDLDNKMRFMLYIFLEIPNGRYSS